jgi:hypothetical protein
MVVNKEQLHLPCGAFMEGSRFMKRRKGYDATCGRIISRSTSPSGKIQYVVEIFGAPKTKKYTYKSLRPYIVKNRVLYSIFLFASYLFFIFYYYFFLRWNGLSSVYPNLKKNRKYWNKEKIARYVYLN